MKNKKDNRKLKSALWVVPIFSAFFILFIGFAYQALAQQVGLTIGYVSSGDAALDITSPNQNLFYGLVKDGSVEGAGFLLFQKGADNDIFKVDISGNIITSGNIVSSSSLALGGALINPSYVLNSAGKINASTGFCINGDCLEDWSAISGGFWSDSGTNIYSLNSGNVGIGTSTPGSRLQVVGVGTTNDTSALNVTNSSNGSLFFVRNDGNVGIGTTTPSTRLHLVEPTANYTLNVGGYRIGNLMDPDLADDAATRGWVESLVSALSPGPVSGDSLWALSGTNLFASSSLWNVGIGTSTPNSRLVVKGAGTTSGTSALNVTNSSNGSLLFVRNDGNVGIGTSNPNSSLDIINTRSAAWLPLANFFAPNNTVSSYVSQLRFGTAGSTNNSAEWRYVHQANGSTANRVDFAMYGTATPAITYNFTGNVGINITTPGSRLVVKGAGTTNATSALNVTNSSNGSLFFVRNDGNVGIGTTTPSTRLHLVGPTGNYTLNVGGYRIGNLMDPDLLTDAATRGYVDSVVGGITVPDMSSNVFGYWNLENGVISNRSEISSSVGVNTASTTVSGVSFAVAQAQNGSGYVSVDIANNFNVGLNSFSRVTGLYTNFNNTFKIGDSLLVSGQASSTITWISTTTQEMIVTPAYASNFLYSNYNLGGVPVGGVARFVVKGSGQVGVGVLDPRASLHISSAATNASSTDAILVSDASSTAAFVVNRYGKVGIGVEEPMGSFHVKSSSSVFVINAEGNVGIGTTTPVELFTVNNGKIYLGNIASSTVPSGEAILNRLYSVNNVLYWGSNELASATTTWSISGNNLFASSTWNVGIGTSTPVSRLQIVGAGETSGTSALNVTNSSNGSLLFVRNDGNVGIGTNS